MPRRYPVVDAPFAADVRLEGFRIQARGIDLAQDWRGVHADMLALIGLSRAVSGGPPRRGAAGSRPRRGRRGRRA